VNGAVGAPAIWHDVECGPYHADLGLWDELATQHGGPVLELGCGTGRVALHLARRGHRVLGVEADPALAAELAGRARDEGLPVDVVVADVGELELAERFPLALAPMQLLQMLGGRRVRRAALERVGAVLAEDGLLAAAIIEGVPPEVVGDAIGLLPDVREAHGWVYSSLPIEIRDAGDGIEIHRLRQMVSPAGELSEEIDVARLDIVDAAALEEEAVEAGLRPVARREIEASAEHVGSTVLLLEAGSRG
jgi:SAM-dependent methyltransferase